MQFASPFLYSPVRSPSFSHNIPTYGAQLWHSTCGYPPQMSLTPFYFLRIRNGFTDSKFIFISGNISHLLFSPSRQWGRLLSYCFSWHFLASPEMDKALCYRSYLCIMKIAVKLVLPYSMCSFGPFWDPSLKLLTRWPVWLPCFLPYLWGTALPHCRCRDPPRIWAHCRWCPGPWWQTQTLVPEGHWKAGPGPGP